MNCNTITHKLIVGYCMRQFAYPKYNSPGLQRCLWAYYLQKIIFIIMMLLVLSNITACSALSKTAWLEGENDDSSWVVNTPETNDAQFYFNDASIKVYKSKLGSSTLLVGPPLIPIIPFWFNKPRLYLPIDIRIDIQADDREVEVDLEKIKLNVPDQDKILEPDDINRAQYNMLKPRLESIQILHNKTGSYRLSYKIDRLDYINKWNDDFSLHFGSVKIGNELVELPPLKLTKEAEYNYIPFYIGGH